MERELWDYVFSINLIDFVRMLDEDINNMQVFLPYPDIQKSIQSLDARRLFKQGLEAYQILNTLQTKGKWKNHPAAKMMAGHESFLCAYGLAASNLSASQDDYDNESIQDGIKSLNIDPDPLNTPIWFGREDVHSSHRSRLLCKGRADAVCAAFKKHFKFRKTDDWLKKNKYPTKNALRFPDVVLLETWAKSLDLSVGANYYDRYGWTDDPSKGYVWPV